MNTLLRTLYACTDPIDRRDVDAAVSALHCPLLAVLLHLPARAHPRRPTRNPTRAAPCSPSCCTCRRQAEQAAGRRTTPHETRHAPLSPSPHLLCARLESQLGRRERGDPLTHERCSHARTPHLHTHTGHAGASCAQTRLTPCHTRSPLLTPPTPPIRSCAGWGLVGALRCATPEPVIGTPPLILSSASTRASRGAPGCTRRAPPPLSLMLSQRIACQQTLRSRARRASPPRAPCASRRSRASPPLRHQRRRRRRCTRRCGHPARRHPWRPCR